MSASEAKTGYSTYLQVNDGSDNYENVAEVVSISGLSLSRDTTEVTHLASDDNAKEFIGNMVDGGELSFEVNYLPTDTSQQALLTKLYQNGTTHQFQIALPFFEDSQAISSIDTGTDVITTATHGWDTGTPVQISTADTLPTSSPQVATNTIYWVDVASTTTVTLHTTNAAAVAGTGDIDFSDAGTSNTLSAAMLWTFSGVVTGFELSGIETNGKLSGNVTIKATGKPTFPS